MCFLVDVFCYHCVCVCWSECRHRNRAVRMYIYIYTHYMYTWFMCVYVHMHICIRIHIHNDLSIYIYIYIYRERERDTYIYIYIYSFSESSAHTPSPHAPEALWCVKEMLARLTNNSDSNYNNKYKCISRLQRWISVRQVALNKLFPLEVITNGVSHDTGRFARDTLRFVSSA